MNKELEKKLYEKYPNLFIQKDWPKTDTCMCWGISVGDGWYSLINSLCSALNFHMKINNFKKSPESKDYMNLQFVQIKEKFGSLRIYIDNGGKTVQDEFVKGLICMVETLSNKTCYHCGNPGTANLSAGIPAICSRCKGQKL